MSEVEDALPAAGVSVRITADPISIAESEGLPTSSDGAMVIFSGIVRDRTEGRAVTGLSYESYNRMAERQMFDIGRIAQREFGATAVLLLHRTGDLQIGEMSVLTAVAAPHRDAAFAACRFCIDALKERAAIWKKELFTDGTSRWVEGA